LTLYIIEYIINLFFCQAFFVIRLCLPSEDGIRRLYNLPAAVFRVVGTFTHERKRNRKFGFSLRVFVYLCYGAAGRSIRLRLMAFALRARLSEPL